MRARMISITMISVGMATAVASCGDPVRDNRVKSLGPERDGVPVGQYHRAGQACDFCHGSDGPASTRFSVAGTVFAQPGAAVGAGNVTVAFTDAAGSQHTVVTNCVGNFFVRPQEWDPAFPIFVRVYGNSRVKTMQGQIGRERSCAFCHHDPSQPPPQYQGTLVDPVYSSASHVYLYSASDAVPPVDPMCPVNPNVTGNP